MNDAAFPSVGSAFDPALWWVRREVDRLIFGGPGIQIGRYHVIRLLGEGGMGIVFHAEDPELDREVALKLLHGHQAGRQGRQRLLREAQAMARLSHPHVVQVYDFGLHEDNIFVAMEYVHGQTLDRWLGGAPRPWRILRELFLQIGHGLAAAHHAGVMHRDLSPRNILVGRSGQPKIVDFGLARTEYRFERGGDAFTTITDARPGSRQVTRQGAGAGTWPYMAPEQQRGDEATYWSDQYSFCLLLWEALYGEYPFPDEDEAANVRAKAEGPPTPPRRRGGAPAVPSRVRRVLVCGRTLVDRGGVDGPNLRRASARDLWPHRQRRSPSTRRIPAQAVVDRHSYFSVQRR